MTVKLAIILILATVTAASAQTTTFRDSMGRDVGTASTDRNGTRTYRDSMGRETGTATRDSGGTRTFRDSSGRLTGTASPSRR